MIVPVEEVYVEALQVKYLIIDWEVYSEDTRRYWRIIRVRNHTEAYQIFADMLKKFNRDDLVELKRLFEPDDDDTLWKLQRYMHDPLVWRLYDACGVDHVSLVRGHDIFMLVEKDYPLSKGVLMLMLSIIEDIDQDAGVTLVQIDVEDQGSTSKVLTDAARVHTYTRRKQTARTGNGRISTASRLISIAKELVSTAGASMPVSTAGMVQESIPSPNATKEKAQKLHEEEQERFNAEQEAKFNAEQEELLASETTEDEANPSIADVDWDNVQAQI
ncbi:hypothetical protein Tco_0755161 [Tanacetum coccineum]